MGQRTVKRVPLDFDWPLHEIWPGFCLSEPDKWGEDICPLCPENAYKPEDMCAWHRETFANWPELSPPTGDGWQLWETTSEGSPISPVFPSAEELAAWCETNATWFGNFKWTREQWLQTFLAETTDVASTLAFRVPATQTPPRST